MRQFDVYRNPNRASSRAVPYLLILQSDLLDEFATRVVVPLVRPSELKFPASRLNATFQVEGTKTIMLTQQIGAVTKSSLKERVTNLEPRRTEIIGAIDFLLGGV